MSASTNAESAIKRQNARDRAKLQNKRREVMSRIRKEIKLHEEKIRKCMAELDEIAPTLDDIPQRCNRYYESCQCPEDFTSMKFVPACGHKFCYNCHLKGMRQELYDGEYSKEGQGYYFCPCGFVTRRVHVTVFA